MIPRIVLTGGPCGGKSSALEYLKTRLPKEGITPIFVPEMATMMFNSGIKWTDDGIIHLNSLAWGEGYSLNNPARFESREDAIKVDERTWQMWSQGPGGYHVRISHEVSLEAKFEQVTNHVIKVIRSL